MNAEIMRRGGLHAASARTSARALASTPAPASAPPALANYPNLVGEKWNILRVELEERCLYMVQEDVYGFVGGWKTASGQRF